MGIQAKPGWWYLMMMDKLGHEGQNLASMIRMKPHYVIWEEGGCWPQPELISIIM